MLVVRLESRVARQQCSSRHGYERCCKNKFFGRQKQQHVRHKKKNNVRDPKWVFLGIEFRSFTTGCLRKSYPQSISSFKIYLWELNCSSVTSDQFAHKKRKNFSNVDTSSHVGAFSKYRAREKSQPFSLQIECCPQPKTLIYHKLHKSSNNIFQYTICVAIVLYLYLSQALPLRTLGVQVSFPFARGQRFNFRRGPMNGVFRSEPTLPQTVGAVV